MNTASQLLYPTRRNFNLGASAALLGFLGLASPPMAQAATTAPALQLAKTARPDIEPAGYLVSEKLDGVRALWDGRFLRFRGGQAVLAPQWFTASLPKDQPLDGELWMARSRFEELSGAVRRHAALDGEWREISYQLFDLPGIQGPFEQRAARLQAITKELNAAHIKAVAQRSVQDRASLQAWYGEVVKFGGEGLVLHRADALWRAGRSDALLKLKPEHDAEATVVAHIPGRGKHAGRVGALQVRTDEGVEFLVGTGLTDAQRESPPPLGSVVSYRFRGLTASGVPRFASFWRVRGA